MLSLKRLIDEYEASGGKTALLSGTDNIQINDIVYDSRRVMNGYAFVCIKGRVYDGAKYIENAIENGATVIFGEFSSVEIEEYKEKVPLVYVNDARAFLALAVQLRYGKPDTLIKVVGIIGKSGMNTIASLAYQCFSSVGLKVSCLIGMSYYGLSSRYFGRTVPQSSEIYSAMRLAKDEGAEVFFIPMTASDVILKRVKYIKFDTLIISDDIFCKLDKDEHEQVALFENIEFEKLICNTSSMIYDSHRIKKSDFQVFSNLSLYGYSIDGSVNDDDTLKVENLKYHLSKDEACTFSAKFRGEKSIKFSSCIPSADGVRDILSIYMLKYTLSDFSIEESKWLNAVSTVKTFGRLEHLHLINKNTDVVIDSAWQPKHIKNILNNLHYNYPQKEVILVFGSSGDRGAEMRRKQGAACAVIDTKVFFTVNSSRGDSQQEILDDLVSGYTGAGGSNCLSFFVRKDAIQQAVSESTAQNLIVLLGMGADGYIIDSESLKLTGDKMIISEVLNGGTNGNIDT